MPLVKNFPLRGNRLFRPMSVFSPLAGSGFGGNLLFDIKSNKLSSDLFIPKFICPNSDLFRHFLYLFEIL